MRCCCQFHSGPCRKSHQLDTGLCGVVGNHECAGCANRALHYLMCMHVGHRVICWWLPKGSSRFWAGFPPDVARFFRSRLQALVCRLPTPWPHQCHCVSRHRMRWTHRPDRIRRDDGLDHHVLRCASLSLLGMGVAHAEIVSDPELCVCFDRRKGFTASEQLKSGMRCVPKLSHATGSLFPSC